MKKTILITGSAGFMGTNLVKRALSLGNCVIGVDNFSSSEKWKSLIFEEDPCYEFFRHDICKPLGQVLKKSKLLTKAKRIDEIYNLACPASPARYIDLSLETIEVNTLGIRNALDLAKKYDSTILHTSTSEVYGDPLEHPQSETYRGNVNTVGPRSCYDEGKRIAETICYEYKRLYDLNVKIVRIFNTYGPYMDPLDGRVVTNFIQQALSGQALTLYEGGKATRSFQYIDDLLDGFTRVMETPRDVMGPINLGNPSEFTIKELAQRILTLVPTKSKMKVVRLDKKNPYQSKHDPKQRKPDITLARKLLQWHPKIELTEGLKKTIAYYQALTK